MWIEGHTNGRVLIQQSEFPYIISKVNVVCILFTELFHYDFYSIIRINCSYASSTAIYCDNWEKSL